MKTMVRCGEPELVGSVLTRVLRRIIRRAERAGCDVPDYMRERLAEMEAEYPDAYLHAERWPED